MEKNSALQVAVIIGSIRSGRFAPVIAKWFCEQIALHQGVTCDVIDLAEADLPSALSTQSDLRVTAIRERLAKADAFVVITPEYNHSFPAALKNAIDWHYEEWRAKPVGFVSYGGLAGGVRAVEHLRQVFAELHAVTVRDLVSFHGARSRFQVDGRPVEPEGCGRAAKVMLDQLVWWGLALRDAKLKSAYPT